jgi:ABC-type sugar transport system ATPase subunit
MEQGPLLTMEDLAYSIDGHALIKPLSFDINLGEVLSILGHSGSGKSTLLQLISGLIPASAGKIVGRGQVWHQGQQSLVPTQWRNLAYVFQDPCLFPHMSVRDNIQIAVSSRAPTIRAKHFAEIVDLTGVAALLDRLPRQISGGQAQRVAIARALYASPDLMLLDEPFSSLDRPTATLMRGELLGWLKNYGMAACFVTHNPDEAFDLSQRIGFLQSGSLLQIAPPDQFYYRPANVDIAQWTGEGRAISLAQDLAAESEVRYLQREFQRYCATHSEFLGLNFQLFLLYARAVDWVLDSAGQPFVVVACQFRGDYFLCQVRGSSGLTYPVCLDAFHAPGSVVPLAYRPRVRPTIIG